MKADKYNLLADVYDSRYTTPECLQENRELAEMLGRIIMPNSTVFDIGCGTGLLLDLVYVEPDRYIGIDPSQRMLDRMREKYPEHVTLQGAYEEVPTAHERYFDVAVALFSGQYVEDGAKARLPMQAEKYLYIFYKPDYTPDYYTPEEAQELASGTDYERLGELFELTEWHNYLIAYKQ